MQFVEGHLSLRLGPLRPGGGFPGGSAGKESTCNVGDLGAIPGLERSPGKGNGYSLQYSCLQNSMDTEEPGGLLLSTGSQRVGYDGMTNTSCIFRLCI